MEVTATVQPQALVFPGRRGRISVWFPWKQRRSVVLGPALMVVISVQQTATGGLSSRGGGSQVQLMLLICSKPLTALYGHYYCYCYCFYYQFYHSSSLNEKTHFFFFWLLLLFCPMSSSMLYFFFFLLKSLLTQYLRPWHASCNNSITNLQIKAYKTKPAREMPLYNLKD